jgi:hypothetical protein
MLDTPKAERFARLPYSALQQDETLNTLQALLVSMQHDLQIQLQNQQRDFEARMESLIRRKENVGQGADTHELNEKRLSPVEPPDSSKTQQPSLATHIGKTSNDTLEASSTGSRFPGPQQSQHREHSPYIHSYSKPFITHDHSLLEATSKIKASDLPKFSGGKDEDVETWIQQISAIFDVNRSSTSEIVAFLSVILKDTALRWFTRLGSKGRARLLTWTLWKEALRHRFLKANYLTEKKRLWKQRDLLPDEDMVDYFDAKVDLQAFVFEEQTPESELILDILDGLPDHMLPTLKASISSNTTLLEFRRTLLDYEKGLRWDGVNEWNGGSFDDNDSDCTEDEGHQSLQRNHDSANEDKEYGTDTDSDSDSDN